MALRYFRGITGPGQGRQFLRFILFVAIGGVAVGVAALILAFSITRGFSEEIERKIIGFNAHIQVDNFQDAPLNGAADLAAQIRAVASVTSVVPVVQELALVRSSNGIDGVGLWGVEGSQSFVAEHIQSGLFTFAPDSAQRPGVVVSRKIAQQLGLRVGDRLTCFSMRDLPLSGARAGALFARPKAKQFYIAGIYDTGFAEFDDKFAFIDIADARELLGYGPDQVTRFDVRVDDVAQVATIAATIETKLGFPVWARTVYQVYRNLFAWVNLQQSIIPLVLTIIVIVAAFNILSTLLMLMLEKTREIGILRSMGASAQTVQRLFIWMGALIGLIGVAGGESLALLLAVLQKQFGLIPLPEDTYYMDTAPIQLSGWDFVIVAGFTLALCILAAYIPARTAARTDPVRAIRFAA